MTDIPPIKLHLDSEANPVAVHKAVPVPIHWQQQVKAELDRDVLEPVPIGEPVACHMVLPDGGMSQEGRLPQENS
jgi:hypothetical protein